MLGGSPVRLVVGVLGQEETETEGQPETEAEAQTEGQSEGQQEEQPLRRSTRARTQAASRTGTQHQSSSMARSTLAQGTPAVRPAPVRIHKDYTRAPTREIQELRFSPFSTWFPAARDQRAHAKFYTVVQEDMYMAFVHS